MEEIPRDSHYNVGLMPRGLAPMVRSVIIHGLSDLKAAEIFHLDPKPVQRRMQCYRRYGHRGFANGHHARSVSHTVHRS